MAPIVVLGTVLSGFALPANAASSSDAVSTLASTRASVTKQHSASSKLAAQLDDPVNITVHSGGVRTALDTVGPMPDGAEFTATWHDDGGDGGLPSGPYSCTIDNGEGTCAITVPAGSNWSIQQTQAPDGYYLSDNLDFGTADVVEPSINAYLTGDGLGGDPVISDIDVPGTDPNGWYQDSRNWGNLFGGLLSASVENPQVPEKCGLNIALVLDQSGSMSNNDKQAALKEAAAQTVTALTGTPSNVAMYTFNTLADPYGHIDSTSTLTADSAAPLQSFVSGLPDTLDPSPLTNWDRGLSQVDGSAFDMVVLLTDGNPTVLAEGLKPPNRAVVFANVEAGVYSANQLKHDGARVVSIGIGLDGGADNLRAVSGQTEDSDYYLASDTDFGDVLKSLSTGTCSNSLTIQKQVEDVDGNLIPNAADSNDWDYTNTISDGTIGGTATTGKVNGNNGLASVPVSINVGSTPTITATETLKTGYELVGAQCTVDGADVPTDANGLTASFTAAANAPMTCVFTNRQLPVTTITHTKKVVPGSLAQADDGTWSLQYEIDVKNTGAYDGAYSLDDALRYGAGITPGTASWTATNGLSGAWPDPAKNPHTILATDQSLATGATDTYTVSVSGIDVAAGVIGSPAGDCPTTPTDTSAFNNGAGLTFNGTTTDAADCAAPSKPTLEKHFVSATPDNDNPGMWAVTYNVVVDNSKGTSDAQYTLMDNSRFAKGVTINGVTIDGVSVVFVDGDVPIITGSPQVIAAGAIKTYTLTFTVTVDDVATDVQTCSSDGAGHGYFNAATLTVAHDEQTASDCAPITPAVDPTVMKTVTSTTKNGDGTWKITYDVTVTQPKKGADNPDGLSSRYNLSDNLAFGGDITVNSASWSLGDGPSQDWLGGFDTLQVFADGQVIAQGVTDTYAVTVNADVKPAAWTNGTTTCKKDGDQPIASGFLNSALLAVDGHVTTVYACSEPKVTPPTPPVTPPTGLAKTGSEMVGPIGLAGLLLAVGATLTFWLRRRRADGSV